MNLSRYEHRVQRAQRHLQHTLIRYDHALERRQRRQNRHGR